MTGEPTEAEVADRLLALLRTELRKPDLTFAEPPTRVIGGFDTMIYAFRLRGAAEEWSQPLILRVFRLHDDPKQARREGAVQTILAQLGYPAPGVLLTCEDKDAFGGAFIVMERLAGRMMLADVFKPSRLYFLLPRILIDIPRILAETQARLHALDPEPLLRALDAIDLPAGRSVPRGISDRMTSVDAQLDHMQRRIDAAGLDWLKPGLEWLREHRPPEPEQRVICHGDFHPLNILMKGGDVTGVIDWAMTTVADPAFDVGNTRVLLEMAPMEFPFAVEWIAKVVRPLLARRYYDAYRRHRGVDPNAVRYYEAMRCPTELVLVGERRLADAGLIEPRAGPNVWGAPRPRNRLMSRFREITGIALALPAGP
jgi:aminoglycoside phosphotransferase (APT) family kinase protein